MYEILFDALLIVIAGFSLMAVYSKDLLKSAILLSAGSVATALVFFLLNAPDIAITKVAIEAGVATAIFIVAIQKTARFEKDKKDMYNGQKPEHGVTKVPASNGKSNHTTRAKNARRSG